MNPPIPQTPPLPQLAELDVDSIEPDPNNPRKVFADPGLDNNAPESVEDMAASIKTHGLFLPIRVRPIGEARYRIISGERRWRAFKLAGIPAIPALIVEKHDPVALIEEQLEENNARLDPDVTETIDGLLALKAAGRTAEELAQRIHKSKSTISNLLRIAPLLTPTVREAMAVTRFKSWSDLIILANRLDEDAVLMLCEHSRALSRDFRRGLTQYDTPDQVKLAIQSELTKLKVEFTWDDEQVIGPANDAFEAKPTQEALAASKTPEPDHRIAPVSFLGGALQVRTVPGRKTTFLVNSRDHDRETQRQAIALARQLLDELARHLDKEDTFWAEVQRRAMRAESENNVVKAVSKRSTGKT